MLIFHHKPLLLVSSCHWTNSSFQLHINTPFCPAPTEDNPEVTPDRDSWSIPAVLHSVDKWQSKPQCYDLVQLTDFLGSFGRKDEAHTFERREKVKTKVLVHPCLFTWQCGWGFEHPITLPLFSNTCTHMYLFPSSAIWFAHSSIIFLTSSLDMRGRTRSERGCKHITRLEGDKVRDRVRMIQLMTSF